MQEKSKEMTRALKKLAVFEGVWVGTGEFLEGADSSAGMHVTVHEIQQWLPGGYFLNEDSVLDFGTGKLEAHRVIGYDEKKHKYVMYAFDSLGFSRQYVGAVDGNTWYFEGEFEKVTMKFSEDHNSLSTFWENSTDPGQWRPLCTTEQTRQR